MKLPTLACAAALLAAGTTVARADEGGTTSDHRDGSTAMMLSAGGAAISVGLFAAGMERNDSDLVLAGLVSGVVAPSLGHWYAGEAGGIGMATRAGGLSLMFVGAVSTICFGDDASCDSSSGVGMMALGGALMIGGVIYDVATASDAAERYNKKHSYSLGPTMVTTGGAPTAGIGLSGSF